MTRPLTLIFLLCLFSFQSFGQNSFQKTWSLDDEVLFRDVHQTSDGGFIIAGIWTDFAEFDAILFKTDSNLVLDWTKRYSIAGTEGIEAVRQTQDGGFVVAGYTASAGAGGDDCLLFKTNSEGDLQWAKAYGGTGGDNAWSVVERPDGGYMLAGHTNSYSSGASNDMYLILTDSFGNVQQSRAYGAAGENDVAYDLIPTDDGNFLILGSCTGGLGGQDICAIKITPAGDTIWTGAYGGPDFDYGARAVETANGGFLLAGETLGFGGTSKDLLIVRVDSLGTLMWAKRLENDGDTELAGLARDASGNYHLAATDRTRGLVMRIKLDPAGDTLRTRAYGDQSKDNESGGMSLLGDGGMLIAAWVTTGSERDGMVVRTDASGNAGGCYEWSTGLKVLSLTIDTTRGLVLNQGAMEASMGLIADSLNPDENVLCALVSTEQALESRSGLHLWPNPAGEKLHLELEGKRIGRIRVMDLRGQVLLEMKGDENGYTEIDLTGISKGMYMVSVNAGDAWITRRFVRAH